MFGKTKVQAGFPLTCYYITYCIAQILFAIFIKKINMKKFVLATVSASSLLLMAVALTQSLTQLTIIMSLIGITHCGIWAGAMYLVSRYIPEERHGYAIGVMSIGFPMGNLLAYALSSGAVALGNWQYAFWAAGSILLVSVLFLFVVLGRVDKGLPVIERTVRDSKVSESGKLKKRGYSPKFLASFSVIILAAWAYQMLDMPIGTYLPDLFHTEFGMPKSYSILISMFLPVAVLGGPFLGTSLTSHRHVSFFESSNLFLAASLVCPILLIFFYKTNIVLTLILTVLYATLTRAFSTCSVTIAPLQIDSEMNAGSITAFSNAGATVACAIVPMLFGFVFDNYEQMAWPIFYGIFIGVILFIILVNTIALFVIRRAEKKS